MFVVLQPPDHYSWIRIEFSSELQDRRSGEVALRYEWTVDVRRNQSFLGKTIGFGLLAIDSSALEVHEHIATSMQDDVSRFVKEGEPQLIFTLGIKAQLYKRLGWRQPTSSSEH